MPQLQLHRAIREGRTEEITKLIEAGADPEELDECGLTPLYWAAYHNHPEAICALVEAGAEPRIRDKNGRTPLHWVSFHSGSRREAYKVLVGAGANVNAKDKFGWTASLRPKFNPCDHAWGGPVS